MKLGRLVLALVLCTACDLRPEDFAGSRANVASFSDTWTKILGDLSTRRTDLFTRASKIPASTPGLDEVLSRLTAVKAKIDDLTTQVSKTSSDATEHLDEHHRDLADQDVAAALDTMQQGAADIRQQLDDSTAKLDTIEQQLEAQPAPAPEVAPVNTAPAALIEPGFARGKGIADVPGIEFQMGSAQLDLTKPTTKPALDAIVTFAGACDTLQFAIIGHTAKDGDANTNQRLSQARAGSVRAYLMNAGVTASKIGKTIGVGGTQPAIAEPDPGSPEEKAMATDKLAAIRDQNRRISIAVITPCG